jgi:hypothetical protein
MYRQLQYRHCSERLGHIAPADRAVLAPETVHIYAARARAAWTHLQADHDGSENGNVSRRTEVTPSELCFELSLAKPVSYY